MPETFETSPKAAAVLRRFREEFGGGGIRLFFAPGRANLIGNHVDYNGGTVLPIAVDQGVFVAARLNEDGTARLRSLDCEPPVDLDLTAIGAVCATRPTPGRATHSGCASSSPRRRVGSVG